MISGVIKPMTPPWDCCRRLTLSLRELPTTSSRATFWVSRFQDTAAGLITSDSIRRLVVWDPGCPFKTKAELVPLLGISKVKASDRVGEIGVSTSAMKSLRVVEKPASSGAPAISGVAKITRSSEP